MLKLKLELKRAKAAAQFFTQCFQGKEGKVNEDKTNGLLGNNNKKSPSWTLTPPPK